MRPPLSHAPLLPVFVAFSTGAIAGIAGAGVWWAIVAVLLSLIGCRLVGDILLVALISFAAGVVAGVLGRPLPLPDDYASHMMCWHGEVVDVTETEGGRRIIADMDSVSGSREAKPVAVSLRAAVVVPSLFPIVGRGDRISAWMQLEPVADMRDLPDEVDYGAALRRNGVSACGVVRPDELALEAKATGMASLSERVRGKIVGCINSSSVSDPTGAMLAALLVGDSDMLPGDTRMEYAATGLAHVLAVSGLHVGIVAVIVIVILWPLMLLRLERLRILLTIGLIWGYVVVAGMPPSAVRAAVMASVLLGAGLLGRRAFSINSLCLAGLLIIACDPLSVMSIGFQLSFAAVASIILLVPLINRIDRRAHPVLWHMVSVVAVPVAAMIGTGAIAAFYFHLFPVYFLLANIVATFVAGPLIAGGIVLVVCEMSGCDPLWLCHILDFLASWISGVASEVASWPGSRVSGIYFRSWLLVPYFAVTALVALALWRRRLVYIVAALMSVAVAWMVAVVFPPCGDDARQEWYIARRTYRTDIVMRDGGNAYLLTTAYGHQLPYVADECRRRYSGYLGFRGIDSLAVVTDTFTDRNLTRTGRLMAFGNKVMAVVTSADDVRPAPLHVDYAVVCRGFTGDVTEMRCVVSADTVILSKDLDVRRHDRYKAELDAAGIPALSLREGKFRRVLIP